MLDKARFNSVGLLKVVIIIEIMELSNLNQLNLRIVKNILTVIDAHFYT